MYQHCAGQRRATNHWADWTRTKERATEPSGSQCHGKCERALEVERPKFKGLPPHSGWRNMAGYSTLMLPQLWNGVPLLTPTELMQRLAELTCSLTFHKNIKLGRIRVCALGL